MHSWRSYSGAGNALMNALSSLFVMLFGTVESRFADSAQKDMDPIDPRSVAASAD